MRLLVDATSHRTVTVRLTAAGYSATHVRDHGLLTASDESIAAFATTSGHAIVSADSDFVTMVAFSGLTHHPRS